MTRTKFIASVKSSEQAHWIEQNTGGTVHNVVLNSQLEFAFGKVQFESEAEMALYLLTWSNNRQY